MKGEILAQITGQISDSANSDLGGVVQVVDDDGVIAAQKKLKNGVAADVPSSTSDQNALRHGCCNLERETTEEEQSRKLI